MKTNGYPCFKTKKYNLFKLLFQSEAFDQNVVAAWARGYTGKGVVVSILDDGLETSHPDIAENYVSCYYHFLFNLYFNREHIET